MCFVSSVHLHLLLFFISQRQRASSGTGKHGNVAAPKGFKIDPKHRIYQSRTPTTDLSPLMKARGWLQVFAWMEARRIRGGAGWGKLILYSRILKGSQQTAQMAEEEFSKEKSELKKQIILPPCTLSINVTSQILFLDASHGQLCRFQDKELYLYHTRRCVVYENHLEKDFSPSSLGYTFTVTFAVNGSTKEFRERQSDREETSTQRWMTERHKTTGMKLEMCHFRKKSEIRYKFEPRINGSLSTSEQRRVLFPVYTTVSMLEIYDDIIYLFINDLFNLI